MPFFGAVSRMAWKRHALTLCFLFQVYGKRVQYYNLRPELLSRKACCISKFSCYSYVQTLRNTTNLATIFQKG